MSMTLSIICVFFGVFSFAKAVEFFKEGLFADETLMWFIGIIIFAISTGLLMSGLDLSWAFILSK